MEVRYVLTTRDTAMHTSSSVVTVIFGQATKGVRWMPWHEKAMKDVISCDKPRGAASKHRSGDVRMGKPGEGYLVAP